MKLYSIRHKETGKFVSQVVPMHNGGYRAPHIYWSNPPKFWRTIDGIRNNLRKMARDQLGYSVEVGEDYWSDRISYGQYHWDRLDCIEVIVTNVSVLGEESFPASDFILETEASA